MKKAQTGLEITIAVSLVVLIFLGFFAFYINKNSEIKELNEIIDLRNQCFKILNAVESAMTYGDGYSIVLQNNNTIRIVNGIILLESDSKKTTSCSYRGNVVSGIYSRNINIQNNNEVIKINNV